jgi:poly-gamma-glutamate synthesis protein (capsule biosynthesis protein)
MMDRRRFLVGSGGSLLAGLCGIRPGVAADSPMKEHSAMQTEPSSRSITLFLCGDVMTGRGIDQILPHPGKPRLFESVMRSAAGYVELAERGERPHPATGGLRLHLGRHPGRFPALGS